MNTLLLMPGLFSADGGIERMMRIYLRAVGELTPASTRVNAITLNDRTIDAAKVAPYRTPALDRVVACARNKVACVWHTLRLARRSQRILCGHINLLRVAHLARRFAPALEVWLIAHGIEVWRDFTAGERRALAATQRILCVSDYTRRELAKRVPEIAPAKLVVQPNALDPQFHAPFNNGTLTQRGLILSVARLSAEERYKGIDDLIRALPAIAAAVPEARLRIVGEGDDRGRLEALAAEHHMTGRVEFTGRVDDAALRGHFAACQLFALPSRGEGFGLVYLEALAHGKPCLVAEAGGAPEVVTEDCGARVTFGNAEQIAERCSAALRREWSVERLRARAAEFSYPRFKDRLRDQFGSVTA